MKPYKIILKNYKSYGEEETEIDLGGNNVKLIFGNIGAGKTAFVDGLIWCLYGESLVNQDEVVNRKNKKNCKVEYIFYVRNDLYSIIRYRKHEIFKDCVTIFKNHKNISPVKKRDAQELINSIIGMSHKAAISSIMFSSEIYISFLRSTEAKRLEIFDSVLNMNIFKKWANTIKKIKAPIEEEYEISKSNIEKLIYGKNTVLQSIEDYKDNIKKKLILLQRDKKNFELEIKKEEIRLKEINSIDAKKELELINKKNEIDNFNKPILDKLKILQKEKEENNLILVNEVIKYNDIKIEIEELENIDVDLEKNKIKINNKNKDIFKKISDLKKEKVEAQKQLEKINKEIAFNKKEIIEKKEKLKANSSNICHTCGQKINKEIQHKIENSLLKLIKESESNLKTLIPLIKTYTELIDSLEKDIVKLNNNIKPVNDVMEIDKLESITSLKTNNIIQINKLKNIIEAKDEKIKYLDTQIIEQKEKLIKEIEGSKYDSKYLEAIFINKNNTEDKIKKLEKGLKEILNSVKGIYNKDYVKTLNEKINKINKRLKKIKIEKENKDDELKQYQFLLKIFSNKDYGIKKYIIGKMINVFNNNINHYIPLFFDKDLKVSFDSNLTETITENKQEINFKSFSSGEKSLLDIAVAFSLYMLVKDFFSSEIEMLIFDEILDRNLDEKGINSIIEVINSLAKDNSIIIISHRQELQENFEKRIRVFKEDGYSKIETFV